MNKLNKDELYIIATKLDLSDLVHWCASSKIIYEKVFCRSEVWLYKLKDFPNYKR